MDCWSCTGEAGSTWSTSEARSAAGWAEVEAPSNLLSLEPPQPAEWQATVSAAPRHEGEQAGLYAFATPASWVKLVVEAAGSGGDTFLAFAEQHSGVPQLRGKVLLPEFGGVVSLRLVTVMQQGRPRVRGFHRLGGPDEGGEWSSLTRGLGWLDASELAPGQRGRLTEGDPRGEQVAECTLPDGWRAVLLTEQWKPRGEGDCSSSQVWFASVLLGGGSAALVEPPHATQRRADARAAAAVTALDAIFRFVREWYQVTQPDADAFVSVCTDGTVQVWNYNPATSHVDWQHEMGAWAGGRLSWEGNPILPWSRRELPSKQAVQDAGGRFCALTSAGMDAQLQPVTSVLDDCGVHEGKRRVRLR